MHIKDEIDEKYYDQGFNAYHDNVKDRDNPYTYGSSVANEWNRGYLDAAYYEEKYRYDYAWEY